MESKQKNGIQSSGPALEKRRIQTLGCLFFFLVAIISFAYFAPTVPWKAKSILWVHFTSFRRKLTHWHIGGTWIGGRNSPQLRKVGAQSGNGSLWSVHSDCYLVLADGLANLLAVLRCHVFGILFSVPYKKTSWQARRIPFALKKDISPVVVYMQIPATLN